MTQTPAPGEFGPIHAALGLSGPAVVATVGGGGKTTLLFALAREQLAAGRRAVLTTTTRFTIPKPARELPRVLESDPGVRLAATAAALEASPAVVVGAGLGERGRVLGVEADWPARALGLPGVGLVGVEADGAAGRMFKAPAAHEPVLPDAVDLVLAVAGVTVLGRTLEAAHVHRPERVIALTGARAGEVVGAERVAAVLCHGEGGRKGLPQDASFAVVVTHAAGDPAGARAIADACHGAGVAQVLAFDAGAGEVRSLS